LVYSLKKSVDAAIDFESSFAGIRKTVDASESEFGALSAGMRALAKEIPINVNELNRIGEAAGQLGIENANILGFTETMAKLGVTTNLSSEQAASSLARLANIMGTSQADFGNMGSVIVDLGNNFATTEAEITEFAQRLAGAGRIAGLTEADVLAIGAAYSSVGVKAEAGGTAVQKVLNQMTQSVAEGNDKLEKFADVAGMSANQFATAWREDPGAAFNAFVQGLGAQGDAAFTTLQGLGLSNERLIRSFLALGGAGDLLDRALGTANTAWEDNSALTEEAGKRFETTASQIQLAKNAVNDLAISLGDRLAPAVATSANVLAELLDLDISGALEAATKDGSLEKLVGGIWPAMGWAVPSILKDGIKDMAGVGEGLSRSQLAVADASWRSEGALAAQTMALRGTGSAADDLTEDVGALGGEMDDATSAADAFRDALDAIAGVEIDAERAAIRYRDEIVSLGKALSENASEGLNRFTEEGRANRTVILDAVEAAKSHAEALFEESGSAEKAEGALRRHVGAIIETAVEAGLSEREVRRYIERLGLTPKEVRTLFKQDGLDDSRNKLGAYIGQLRSIDGSTVTTQIRTVEVGGQAPGIQLRHAGGTGSVAGPRRAMGRRPDEFATLLKRSETVFTASQMSALGGVIGGGGGSTLNFTIHADSTTNGKRLARVIRQELEKDRRQDARDSRWQPSLAT
jgi:TP901 family phage tail tape measure protein